MVGRALAMITLNALKISYLKKVWKFTTTINWAVVILMCQKIHHSGQLPGMWKKWKRYVKDLALIIFIYWVIPGAACWPWNMCTNTSST